MTSAPIIKFSGVRQRFHASDGSKVIAIDHLNLSVTKHEFVVVVGPSGCGKSTLLRLIAGLISPSAGRIEIYGQEVIQPRDEIGIVFQRPTMLPWLTAFDNVTFPMRHKYGRVTAAEKSRAAALLDMVGLTDFANKMPNELSGGMQQRVAIARALLHDPDILLMDEPFSALDALTRDEMSLELMRIWQERPKTVVFVTHSIPEAVLLADRIVVMSARPGRISETVDVDLPRPRSLSTLAETRFHDIQNHIRRSVFHRAAAA